MTPNEKDEREALLPCPFCGSTNIKFYHYARSDVPESFYQCADCGTIPGKSVNGEEAARTEWNRRASLATEAAQAPTAKGDRFYREPAAQAQVDALQDAIAALAQVEFTMGHLAGSDDRSITPERDADLYAEHDAAEDAVDAGIEALIAAAKAERAPAPISDGRIAEIWQGMPGGWASFLKEWGYLQFAHALLAEAAPAASKRDSLEEAARKLLDVLPEHDGAFEGCRVCEAVAAVLAALPKETK